MRLTRTAEISIHAPAKGATKTASDYVLHNYISIHAPAKGATQAKINAELLSLFQSTLPRRERLYPVSITAEVANFNPRSREGSDARAFFLSPSYFISIHAPAKGATIAKTARTINLSISIHAPAKGATC